MPKHTRAYYITRTLTRAIFYTLITIGIIYLTVFIN